MNTFVNFFSFLFHRGEHNHAAEEILSFPSLKQTWGRGAGAFSSYVKHATLTSSPE